MPFKEMPVPCKHSCLVPCLRSSRAEQHGRLRGPPFHLFSCHAGALNETATRGVGRNGRSRLRAVERCLDTYPPHAHARGSTPRLAVSGSCRRDQRALVRQRFHSHGLSTSTTFLATAQPLPAILVVYPPHRPVRDGCRSPSRRCSCFVQRFEQRPRRCAQCRKVTTCELRVWPTAARTWLELCHTGLMHRGAAHRCTYCVAALVECPWWGRCHGGSNASAG